MYVAVPVHMFCIYLDIVFLPIFCTVCVLGFRHAQCFVNLCCVLTFIVFSIYVYCDLDMCFMIQINVLCFICVYCALKYVIYVLNKCILLWRRMLCFGHVYCVLHLWPPCNPVLRLVHNQDSHVVIDCSSLLP